MVFDKIRNILLFTFLLLLPIQLGKHFFLDFSFINGVRIDYLAPTLYLLDILAVGLFVLNWKVIANHLQKNAQIFLVFAVLGGVNILLAREPLIALYTAVRYAEMYFLFIVFRNLDSILPVGRQVALSVRSRMTLIPLLIGSVVELGLSVYHIWAGQSAQGIFYWLGERAFSASTPGIATISLFDNVILRPYGTFSHPNSMAGFYLLVYVFVLMSPMMGSYRPAKQDSRMTAVRFGLLVISSCLILISFSKIAIFCFLLVNVYYLFRGIKLDCKLCKFARITSLGVVSLIFLSGQSDILSWEKRVLLLQQSIGVLVAHPLFGVGLGNSLYYQSNLTSMLPYSFIQPVHNIFLLLVTEFGLVGLFVALFLLGKFWEPRRLRKFRELPGLGKSALFWCLLVIGITGFFDHYWLTLIQNQLLIGVILGLCVRSYRPSTSLGTPG